MILRSVPKNLRSDLVYHFFFLLSYFLVSSVLTWIKSLILPLLTLYPVTYSPSPNVPFLTAVAAHCSTRP